jgi:hypothetical protein
MVSKEEPVMRCEVLLGVALALWMSAGCKKGKSGSNSAAPSVTSGDTTSSATSTDSSNFDFDSLTAAEDPNELRVSGHVGIVAASNRQAVEGKSLRLTSGDTGSYHDDPTEFSVHDETRELYALSSSILCAYAQTLYPRYLGEGTWVSMLDTEACFSRGRIDPGTTVSAPSQKARALVRAMRDGSSGPYTIGLWFDVVLPEEESLRIHAELVPYRRAHERNPYGVFRLRYWIFDKGDLSQKVRGVVETIELPQVKVTDPLVVNIRQTEVSLGVNDAGAGSSGTVSRLVFDEQGRNTSGVTRYHFTPDADLSTSFQPEDAPSTLLISYDSSRMARIENGKIAACFDRDAPKTLVYRYGVYDASTFDRVYANKSFYLIERAGDDEEPEFGMLTGYNPPFQGIPEPSVGDKFIVHVQDDEGKSTGTAKAVVAQSPGIFVKQTQYPVSVGVTKLGTYLTQEDFYTHDDDMDHVAPHQAIVRWNDAKTQWDVLERVEPDAGPDLPFTVLTKPERYLVSGSDILLTVGIDQRDIPTLRVTMAGDGSQAPTKARLNLQPHVTGTLLEDTYFRCLADCLRPDLSPTLLNDDAGRARYFPDPTSAAEALRYVYDVRTQTLLYVDGESRLPVTLTDPSMAEPTASWPSINLVLESELDELASKVPFTGLSDAATEIYQWSLVGDAAENAEANRMKFLQSEADGSALPVRGNKKVTYRLEAKDLIGEPARLYEVGTYVVLGIDEFGFLQGIPANGDDHVGFEPSFSLQAGTKLTGLDGSSYLIKPLDVVERLPELSTSACEGVAAEAFLSTQPLPRLGELIRTPSDAETAIMPFSQDPRVVAGRAIY